MTTPRPAEPSLPPEARDVPVLLLAFNRPRHLAKQINALRQVKPRRVFVSIDGPRGATDEERVSSTVEALNGIDWDCALEVRRSETNLGCRQGPVTGMNWFFDHVEQGVILEDDVIPIPHFFTFMRIMLERYSGDDRVGTVCGINRVPARYQGTAAGYRFSRFAHVWGWATWRRTWNLYREDITDWQEVLPFRTLRREVDESLIEALYWRRMFNAVSREGLDAWDAQLEFLALSRGLLSVAPRQSLVSNIGFGAEATHTFVRQPHLEIPDESTVLDLKPIAVVRDVMADRWESRHVRGASIGGTASWVARRAVRTLLPTKLELADSHRDYT